MNQELSVRLTWNDEDRRQHGIKNMVYSNRMRPNSSLGRPFYNIHPSEAEALITAVHIIRFAGTAIHELIGQETGKLLVETAPGKYN